MTIAAAWVRTLENGAEEMVFCSDSRLCGGKRFDHGQKIFRFGRSDAAICFAGRADWAYPMIVAAINAASVHVPSETRSLSLAKFKSHVVNILNQMQHEVHNFARDENIPDVTFLLGGYDWWNKCFRLWRLQFDKRVGAFRVDERIGSNNLGGLGKIEIAGDDEWVNLARQKIKSLAQERYGVDMRRPPESRFNMEPFEAIRDLLRASDRNHSIGGAPQAVKIYQYLNSVDVGIFWPALSGGRLFLSGRPLLEYERATIRSVVDPDSLVSTWANGSSVQAAESVTRALANDRERKADEDPLAAEIPGEYE